MRTILLLLAAASLPNCLLIADSRGTISATWNLVTPAGTTQECLPGETVTIAAGSYSFTFACSAHMATTGFIPAGTYDAEFTFNPADGTSPVTVIRQTVTVFRNADSDVGTLNFQIAQGNGTGSVTFQWELYFNDAFGPLACNANEFIRFTLPGQAPYDTPACNSGPGATRNSETVSQLAPGTYTYTAQLFFNGAPETGDRTFVSDSFVIVADTNVTEPITFEVDDPDGVHIGHLAPRQSMNAPARRQ